MLQIFKKIFTVHYFLNCTMHNIHFENKEKYWTKLDCSNTFYKKKNSVIRIFCNSVSVEMFKASN